MKPEEQISRISPDLDGVGLRISCKGESCGEKETSEATPLVDKSQVCDRQGQDLQVRVPSPTAELGGNANAVDGTGPPLEILRAIPEKEASRQGGSGAPPNPRADRVRWGQQPG